MHLFFYICLGLSAGVLLGIGGGSFKWLFHKKAYTSKQIDQNQRLLNKAAVILKILTFTLLLLGLIWCVYLLVLGLWNADLLGYATNMAQLIVSLLTVISILFAFLEFLRR